MPNKSTKPKKEAEKRSGINFRIDFFLSFFVIIVPIVALILYALGVDIPKTVLGVYVSAVFIISGIAFITFAVLEKFGFGKAGTYFGRISGWKQLTKKEAKANTVVFGGAMIALGIFFAVLTAIYC